MNDRQLSYRDLLDIVQLVKASSHFSVFHLKMGDVELTLRRAAPERPDAKSAPGERSGSQHLPPPVATPHGESSGERHDRAGGEPIVNDAPAKRPGAAAHPPALYPVGSVFVKSPMVGTFYRAPEPGAQPFVQVGQKVDADTVVCIIEVMKLMNSITAGHAGVITRVLAEDAQLVEYGEVLMAIEARDEG